MIISLNKHPRIRLDSESYRELRWQVLQRDEWRCQLCGSRRNLQVHHIKPRSQCRNDSDDNLITLYSQCHGQVHSPGCVVSRALF